MERDRERRHEGSKEKERWKDGDKERERDKGRDRDRDRDRRKAKNGEHSRDADRDKSREHDRPEKKVKCCSEPHVSCARLPRCAWEAGGFSRHLRVSSSDSRRSSARPGWPGVSGVALHCASARRGVFLQPVPVPWRRAAHGQCTWVSPGHGRGRGCVCQGPGPRPRLRHCCTSTVRPRLTVALV